MTTITANLQISGWLSMRQWSRARYAILLPLILILALQGIATLTLHNTVFQDESLYIYSGRAYFNHLLGGPIVAEPYGLYLSGAPFFYPIIAGALDTIGGLATVRLFSLACMLFTTLMIYLIASHLYRQDIGVLAAGLFAVQGSVIFLGGFATYDALCLALLSLATVLAIHMDTRKQIRYVLLVGLLLFAAVAAKYAALLFVPGILAILGWQLLRGFGLWPAIWRVTLALGLFLGLAGLALLSNHDIREGLVLTTTNRTVLDLKPTAVLVGSVITWLGPLIVLAVVGLLLSRRAKPMLSLLFFGIVLLAPAYHIYKSELTSMYKHMAFSAMFAAPLAAYVVARLAGYMRRDYVKGQWIIAFAALLLFWSSGVTLAHGFYAQWTDSTTMVNVLRTQVRPSGRILAEESDVPRYYLQDIVYYWQWNNLYFFDYTDKAGNYLTGVEAYKAAINDGYWDLIVFRYGPGFNLAHAIDDTITSSAKYELITKIPVGVLNDIENYWVWRKIAS